MVALRTGSRCEILSRVRCGTEFDLSPTTNSQLLGNANPPKRVESSQYAGKRSVGLVGKRRGTKLWRVALQIDA